MKSDQHPFPRFRLREVLYRQTHLEWGVKPTRAYLIPVLAVFINSVQGLAADEWKQAQSREKKEKNNN